LGYLPRLRILHTSRSTHGQIYVPWINWFLLVSVLILVFTFRSSARLAFAYGVAVTGTITITTLLLFYVAYRTWRTPLPLLIAGAAALLSVDLLFLGANLTKIGHGAWFPLVIGLLAFTVMTTWQRGRQIVTARRERMEGTLADFVRDLDAGSDRPDVVPGTAIFLSRGGVTAPLALRANVEFNHVRHEQVVIASIEVDIVPRVPPSERIVSCDNLGDKSDGVTHVIVRFGYMDRPNLPSALALLEPEQTEGRLDLDHATYFLSKIELREGDEPDMPRWRKRVFIATAHITSDEAEHFALPSERTVLLGARVDV
jgi:KUP system potassium uptake protein